jgi:hypothetical protein
MSLDEFFGDTPPGRRVPTRLKFLSVFTLAQQNNQETYDFEITYYACRLDEQMIPISDYISDRMYQDHQTTRADVKIELHCQYVTPAEYHKLLSGIPSRDPDCDIEADSTVYTLSFNDDRSRMIDATLGIHTLHLYWRCQYDHSNVLQFRGDSTLTIHVYYTYGMCFYNSFLISIDVNNRYCEIVEKCAMHFRSLSKCPLWDRLCPKGRLQAHLYRLHLIPKGMAGDGMEALLLLAGTYILDTVLPHLSWGTVLRDMKIRKFAYLFIPNELWLDKSLLFQLMGNSYTIIGRTMYRMGDIALKCYRIIQSCLFLRRDTDITVGTLRK